MEVGFKKFLPLRASVWSKNKGGPSLDASLRIPSKRIDGNLEFWGQGWKSSFSRKYKKAGNLIRFGKKK